VSVSSVPVERAVVQFRDAGRSVATILGGLLFAVGWVVAKSFRLLIAAAAGLLFAAGWVGGRVLWPALVWSAAAVRIGWEQGRKPTGGRRGPG
jgi:hypothetical protein